MNDNATGFSVLTILQYVNFVNNKPIGKIKYALN